jgi:hypothetical protein
MQTNIVELPSERPLCERGPVIMAIIKTAFLKAPLRLRILLEKYVVPFIFVRLIKYPSCPTWSSLTSVLTQQWRTKNCTSSPISTVLKLRMKVDEIHPGKKWCGKVSISNTCTTAESSTGRRAIVAAYQAGRYRTAKRPR